MTRLIIGTGSRFGKGTAIALAKQGHNAIVAAQYWLQVTLHSKAESYQYSPPRVGRMQKEGASNEDFRGSLGIRRPLADGGGSNGTAHQTDHRSRAWCVRRLIELVWRHCHP